MFLHVTQAAYIDDYRVRVSFNDGASGEIDLSAELAGEIFEPLKDKSFFKSFQLEGHTLAWSHRCSGFFRLNFMWLYLSF